MEGLPLQVASGVLYREGVVQLRRRVAMSVHLLRLPCGVCLHWKDADAAGTRGVPIVVPCPHIVHLEVPGP
jgi:hypothetical protein